VERLIGYYTKICISANIVTLIFMKRKETKKEWIEIAKWIEKIK